MLATSWLMETDTTVEYFQTIFPAKQEEVMDSLDSVGMPVLSLTSLVEAPMEMLLRLTLGQIAKMNAQDRAFVLTMFREHVSRKHQ